MPEYASERMEKNAERLLLGDSHPVLAIVAFVAVFVFAALPFILDADKWYFVAPCLIGCFSSFFLFLRLFVGLDGELAFVKHIFLIGAACLCYLAGEQWYLVAALTGGTILCSFVLARIIGPFVPVIRRRT